MSELIIRVATPDDEKALRGLATRLTVFELPQWRTATEIANADARSMLAAVHAGSSDNEVFVVERDGSTVGCLHMQTATDFFGRRHAHIAVIATTDAAEGSGVGRALMRHAESWARGHDLQLLTLNVFAANAHARRFYERAGFAPELVKYVKPM